MRSTAPLRLKVESCAQETNCRMSASVRKKELQGVEDEGNESKSAETMGLANRKGNKEAPRDQDC